MRRLTLFVAAALVLGACRSTPDYSRALPEGASALIPLGRGEPYPDLAAQWGEREEILPALHRSIEWMGRPHSRAAFPKSGITHERARVSLERFADLLEAAYGPDDFQQRMEEEFQAYVSAGWDGDGGGVLFTAYCTPILPGRLEPDAAHVHPLYALPSDLVKGPGGRTVGWKTAVGQLPSYPSRGAIEANGILAGRGLELVWLADPIDAYLAHVNGSAYVELPDGSLFRVGYAGKNGRPYRSLGRELESEGRIPAGQASLDTIRAWAADASQDELYEFLHRNESYVFFTPIDHAPHGSLDVPVEPGRSIATDKSLFPPAAVVFVEAEVPGREDGPPAPFRKVLLDQDTGGAIRTAGRADLYLGVGPEAEARSGRTRSEGQLYYFFVRE